MCDYSLHAVRTRDAVGGETLMTTTFQGTATRGLAAPNDPGCAVCLKPGTELAFAGPVSHDDRWIWTRTHQDRFGKFVQVDTDFAHAHHDAIEFNDGTQILLTQLVAGQAVTVVQLPNTKPLRTQPLVIDLSASESSAQEPAE